MSLGQNWTMSFSLLHHLFLKGFGKAVTIFVTHFGVLGADSSFPLCHSVLLEPDLVSDFSLLPELYFFFFAMPSSIKFFLYCGLIITNTHASSALGDTGLICPSAWGSFFFWKGLDLQWNFIWAGEAVPEHFLVLLILHVSPANGSVSRVTFSGLAESFECTPALLCTKGSHISRAFLTLAL